jgi:hypothetical protein
LEQGVEFEILSKVKSYRFVHSRMLIAGYLLLTSLDENASSALGNKTVALISDMQ